MINVTNPLLLPLLLLAWSADLWLWLAAASLIGDRFWPSPPLCSAIRPLARALPNLIRRWWQKGTGQPASETAIWIVTLTGVLVLRYLILYGVMLTQAD